MNKTDVLDFLTQAFEDNFERLRQETGRSITEEIKASALQQIYFYWEKLNEVASNVTETEVQLTLPEQVTPEGRRFTLQGVVDIVREDEQITMYDIKTYLDADAAGEYIEPHYKQLNVYAHIWQTLRGQDLDKTAIIATRPTRKLQHAMRYGPPERSRRAFQEWNPILDIEVDQSTVQDVINEFACVVDKIENHAFEPPPVEVLLAPTRPNSKTPFGTDVCRNCDARFSCSSYRHFMMRNNPNQKPDQVINYYLNDYADELSQNEWLDANLATLGRNRFGEGQER